MNFVRFFVPGTCCICGEITKSAFDCKKFFFNSGKNRFESPFCEHCTQRMEKSFYKARRKIDGIDNTAVFLFGFSDETVERAIYHLKTQNCAACRAFFAKLAGEVVKDMLSEETEDFCLSYIPRSISLFDKYGFDQSEEVLRTFVLSNPSFSFMKLFERDKRYKTPQRALNKKQRLINAGRSLKLSANSYIPQRIIILDDMITTGASAATAYKLLSGVGRENVSFLFLAGTENIKERRNKNE